MTGRLLLHAAIVAGSLLAVHPASGQGWRPGLFVGTRYNFLQTENEPMSWTGQGVLAPRLGLTSSTEHSSLSLQIRRQYAFEPTISGNLRSLRGRAVTDDASGRADRTWSEGVWISADGRYIKSRDLLEPGQSLAATGAELATWGGSVLGGIPWGDAAYSIRGASYPAPGAREAYVIQWNTAIVPVRKDANAGLVNYRQRQIQLGAYRYWQTRMLTAGLRRGLGPGFAAQLEAGQGQVVAADGAGRIGPVVVLSASGWGRRDAPVTGEVIVQRYAPPHLSVRINRGYGDTRVWARAESMTDVEGGASPGLTRVRRFGLGIEDTLARATVIGAEGTYTLTRLLDEVQTPVTLARTSGWVARRLRPWLDLRVTGSYLFDRRPNPVDPTLVPIIHRLRFDAGLNLFL
jgi:hypothetical protein